MAMKPPDPQVVVIFGASGDLTRRKLLPALYHLFVENMLPEGFAVVGYSRSGLSDEDFRAQAREALERFARCSVDAEEWSEFARRLSYVSGGFDGSNAMDHLRGHLDAVDRRHRTQGGRLYYAATPPAAYPSIAARLSECGLHEAGRIVVEKPFGEDLASARELNAALHRGFDESQIFRIDHYLGKETIQNILALRFANGMFEPIWNRRYVDSVRITVAEEIGIEGRATFYEETGTIRDMVQTHLFQVLTFVAMEPPVSLEPDRLRDEKVRVLRSMRPVDPHRVVRGQFEGYRDQPGVSAGSQAETYAALQVEMDNWRWAGVPFHLRTGKRMNQKLTEISLLFRHVPFNVFGSADEPGPVRDALVVRVQPEEGISIHLNVKKRGVGLMDLERASLDFDYEKTFSTPLLEAYELLLLEAMLGDHTLFTREDEVERAWEVLAPLLRDPPPVVPYRPGSWGPPEADALVGAVR